MIRVLDSAGSTLVEWGRQQHNDSDDGDGGKDVNDDNDGLVSLTKIIKTMSTEAAGTFVSDEINAGTEDHWQWLLNFSVYVLILRPGIFLHKPLSFKNVHASDLNGRNCCVGGMTSKSAVRCNFILLPMVNDNNGYF